MPKTAIAGGGIGGLATALSLARRGHDVVVLERRDCFTEIGAGIQLGPNAFQALDRLGVGDPVRDRAVHIDELRFMDGTTDEKVVSMPLTGTYRARFGNPYAVVHRIDLYEPLLQACRAEPAVELRVDCSVERYEQDADGVTVQLANGERVRADALIGADGINSFVRKQLVGDGYPKVSGHTIYRSVIPMEEVPEELRWNTVTLWAGPKWHFVHYPIGSGEFLNLAATRDDGATEAVLGLPVERAHVLGEFPGLGGTARRLLELGRDWKSWVLCDRDPVDRWTDGRVVLVGDAAHPMLQYAAQGACQALEDAVVLGELIGTEPADFAQRFEKFNAERRERTAATQLLAREMGRRLYHPAGEAATARNAMLRSLSEEDLYEKVQWLHGGEVGTGRAPAPVPDIRRTV
ncbi:3-hydroxybenzoate 6-monooxygenase [Streptomyces viridochromogenes]|uniref:Putative oxidoreductase n=1 Tax=Streptomyces viridochromogenes Tue57 TaxID=1160705 RepID=L8PAY1_STRVR|nr:3-hydroxybenzoate 6-monooxygenase [Streptomyces viridochromogenes]ELS53343.1 putative oxidoreductase [Streptomyces viridochromogenes Tue57]